MRDTQKSLVAKAFEKVLFFNPLTSQANLIRVPRVFRMLILIYNVSRQAVVWRAH